jgi:hypothetical protein
MKVQFVLGFKVLDYHGGSIFQRPRLNQSSAAPSKVKPEDEMRSRAKCKPDFGNALSPMGFDATVQLNGNLERRRGLCCSLMKGIMLCSWGEGGNFYML